MGAHRLLRGAVGLERRDRGGLLVEGVEHRKEEHRVQDVAHLSLADQELEPDALLVRDLLAGDEVADARAVDRRDADHVDQNLPLPVRDQLVEHRAEDLVAGYETTLQVDDRNLADLSNGGFHRSRVAMTATCRPSIESAGCFSPIASSRRVRPWKHLPTGPRHRARRINFFPFWRNYTLLPDGGLRKARETAG